MLMPFLASYLAGPVGLAAWAVGLVLGMRNFSQQGLFLLGGALADKYGYKPLIVAGCILRTVGFELLAVVESLPALLVAMFATGFAGALFNPAVRAYLAADSGDRRIEAFALFNVFYQAGILLGPLLGIALTAVDFRVTCLVAAAVFAFLTLLQVRALPQRSGSSAGAAERPDLRGQWRAVLTNRSFLLFSLAMAGSYVLSFQVYLALPLEVRRLGGTDTVDTIGVGLLFAASGLATIAGQKRVTAWCKQRLTPPAAIALGLVTMGVAFFPLLLTSGVTADGTRDVTAAALVLAPPIVSALLLALGTMIAFPFEMDTIVNPAGDELVATHYGLYNTIAGIGITAGNLLTGLALGAARDAGLALTPWVALALLGALSALAICALQRNGNLEPVAT